MTGPLSSPAEQLVAFFRQLFQHAPNAYPSHKELDQANMLITQHGFERAKHIVEYSYQAAQKTKYEPSTFGGILQYTAAALASYDEERKLHYAKTAIAQCSLCDSSGYLHFKRADGEIFSTPCPHDPKKIEAREKRDGLTRIT